jgi:hypothetical protein
MNQQPIDPETLDRFLMSEDVPEATEAPVQGPIARPMGPERAPQGMLGPFRAPKKSNIILVLLWICGTCCLLVGLRIGFTIREYTGYPGITNSSVIKTFNHVNMRCSGPHCDIIDEIICISDSSHNPHSTPLDWYCTINPRTVFYKLDTYDIFCNTSLAIDCPIGTCNIFYTIVPTYMIQKIFGYVILFFIFLWVCFNQVPMFMLPFVTAFLLVSVITN